LDAATKFRYRFAAREATDMSVRGDRRGRVGWGGWATVALAAIITMGSGSCSTSMESSPDISALVLAGTAPGACLIEYNTALVNEGADPCCRTNGGANNCNLAVQCNDRSGGGCCLFYSTDNTTIGNGCCRYAGGAPPSSATGEDVTAPCNALLGVTH
jgi:hypothetical protein